MRIKKIISSVLSVIMLAACLPCNFAFAENNFEKPTERSVYLHAGDRDPSQSSYSSTMYKNETGNIYLAVDNPNKTEFTNGNPTDAKYCMNGYTVKIYYNPNYFDFGGKTDSSGVPIGSPIIVDIPDDHYPNGQRPTENDEDFNDRGYRIQDSSKIEKNCVTIDGESYNAAYVTVFFQGFYLPEMTWDGWYDLCALPLTPIKKGTTNVYINIYQQKDHQLEIFAKNESDKIEDQTFEYNLINSGTHTIEITDRGTPAPPVANPKPDRYTTAQEVELTAEDGCTIYYKDSTMTDFKPYNPDEKISVRTSTTIECYAERTGIKSNVKSYTYNIVPEMPRVFIKDKSGTAKLLENSVYNEPTDIYNVYASDTDDFDALIEDDTDIFYTFSESASTDGIGNGDGATDAFTDWVKLDKGSKAITIKNNCTLRLVTRKTNTLTHEVEFSDVKICNLGIRPAEVTASVASGTYTEEIHVTLSCKTTGATIYYTLNGKNPLTDGYEYSIGEPITISTNTTLRAAAKFDGQDGKVSSYFYMFNINGDYGIQAFYPPAVYEGSVTVTLMANNPENSIKYRYEGESELKDYNGEILTITENTTIYAKAGKTGDWDRDEQEFKYEIRPMPPVFAPPSTQFTNADEVTVSCVESTDEESSKRYKLYYTTDGSDPITKGKLADEESDSVTLDISKYTVIKAVVEKDDGNFSTIVTHSYDIVTSKPTKPLMTLNQGKYIRKIGNSEGYSTQFMPVAGDVNIYYRTDGKEPITSNSGTILYQKYEPINLKGHTVIKAVSVNSLGTKSDTALFDYTIIPEAPKTPPSTLDLSELPVIKVEAVADDNNRVFYTIGDFENSVDIADCTDGVFYINLKTGNAYKTNVCNESELLGAESSESFTDFAYLSIKSVLDGVESDVNEYMYAVSENAEALTIPYADKETGEYEESADADGDYLKINLSSLNKDAEIQYRIGNNGEWQTYNGTIGIKEYTILQIRSHKNIGGKDIYSGIKSYVYTFIPLPPVLTPESGRYLKSEKKKATVTLSEYAPTSERYTIYIRKNGDDTGDDTDDAVDENSQFLLDHTMSFKAYVVNEKTGRKSKNTINYYIIENESLNGRVELAYPYDDVLPDVAKRMNADLLGSGKYAEGIKLFTRADAVINYRYTYSYIDSETSEIVTVSSDNKLIYKNTPIMVNPQMTDIKITAWLTDDAGNDIANSLSNYEIEFVHLEIPKTSLGSEKVEFAKNTKYTLINDYPTDNNIFLYYTLDGSDPTSAKNESRKIYASEELTLTGAVTVKAVYMSACGKCVNCKDDNKTACLDVVYGTVGEYKYTTPTVQYTGGDSGGGGGGGNKVTDNTRKFTKDIFGTEHPTHISYINGYPDGSVQPDGNVTREETTSVLYRITNHEYEKPYVATGDIFPDVDAERWSAHDIEYMAEKEIVSGYPDGEFKPTNRLTRAEFAALICRFAKLENAENENPFSDVEKSHWAYEYILSLAQSGLVEGYEDGTFKPENEITRAEVMTVINKILGRNPSDAYVKSLNFNPYTDLAKDKWYYTAVMEATVTHDYWLDKNGVEEKWENWK